MVLAALTAVGVLAATATALAMVTGGTPAARTGTFAPAPAAAGSATSPASGAASPTPGRSASPGGAAGSGTPVAGVRLLFGIGSQADAARRTALVQQAPVKMLTSWYNGPKDLSRMSGWRGGTVSQSYAAGYALHLIVWTNDPEGPVSTPYGPACGRAYPLSDGFLGDMQQLARTFAGAASGPPLYVTMFTEFQTYPCVDNKWNPDTATTNYYRVLQDQYRAAYRTFHQYAPNARVSLGWGGWQASYDNPAAGGGRSLFGHFADLMRMSDFQSFQAMDKSSNVANIRAMVSILGGYGPVMLAHYKPNGGQSMFDADVRAVFTDAFLAAQSRAGLFAVSFMDNVNLSASSGTFAFVRDAVARYGRGW